MPFQESEQCSWCAARLQIRARRPISRSTSTEAAAKEREANEASQKLRTLQQRASDAREGAAADETTLSRLKQEARDLKSQVMIKALYSPSPAPRSPSQPLHVPSLTLHVPSLPSTPSLLTLPGPSLTFSHLPLTFPIWQVMEAEEELNSSDLATEIASCKNRKRTLKDKLVRHRLTARHVTSPRLT